MDSKCWGDFQQRRHSRVYWGHSLRRTFEKEEPGSFPSSCWFKALRRGLAVWGRWWQVHIVHTHTHTHTQPWPILFLVAPKELRQLFMFRSWIENGNQKSLVKSLGLIRTFRGWRDGSCSPRGQECGSQHPHWVPHNSRSIGSNALCCPQASTHMSRYKDTYIHVNENQGNGDENILQKSELTELRFS